MKNNKLNFGNFVRAQLKNPDSEISQAKRRLSSWKSLVANNPKNYYIECNNTTQIMTLMEFSLKSEVDDGCIFSVGDLMRFNS